MIARIWRGAVKREDADEYDRYIADTGLAEYTETPGNQGAWLLRRGEGDRTEFIAFTFCDSMDAVRAFAGDEPEKAVYYPKDDAFLIEREETVKHYEVTEGPAGP